MKAPVCPYCGTPSRLSSGREVYPYRANLAHKWFWACFMCEAWVGCHPGTKNPLGRLANKSLRDAKRAAHDHFDALWYSGAMSRKQAYAWLAGKLGIPVRECHIGMFDEAMCARVVALFTPETVSNGQDQQARHQA